MITNSVRTAALFDQREAIENISFNSQAHSSSSALSIKAIEEFQLDAML